MLRIVGCIAFDHDLGLVLLAAILCLIGVSSSIIVFTRAMTGENRRLWFALLTVCAGSTTWATHFLAMLAYQSAVPITYGLTLTTASYVVGIVVMGLGFHIALRRVGKPSAAILGGAVVGAGVSALHYVGMAALKFPGTLTFDLDLVIASTVLSSLFGAGSVYAMTCWQHRFSRPVGGGLMLLMIVALHFTGMGAIQMQLGLVDTPATGILSRPMLALAVTAATLMVLITGTFGAIVDYRLSRRLAKEADRFRTLADGALEALVIHRDGVIVDVNAAARRMFDLPAVLGAATIDKWFEGPEPGKMRRAIIHGDEAIELVLPGSNGRYFPAEIWRKNMQLQDGSEGELLAIRDLTTRKESEAKIEHLALHDQLTDLPNRRLFLELLIKAISQAQRSQERFATFVLDLDGFKLVNDMHGHAAGDELLKTISSRIVATLRSSDVLARFGGDEFVILQHFTTQPLQSMTLAERLIEIISEPVRLQNAEVSVSASIGIAIYPDDGINPGDLVRNADTAMYRAKVDGKATARFFEAQMDAEIENRRRLESRLRLAVAEEKLTVAFQPLVDSDDKTPRGFEALVRWQDEELGSIPPCEFIPVAEESGLIVPIGEFVLRRACFEAVGWSQPLRVAVNLSAVQFKRRGLVDMVSKALNDSGLDGTRLELEVTESLLIENRDEVLRTLTGLKALGISIAMDDFGTGYSSLSYLQSFPFDKIKIDRVFVSALEEGSHNESIVRAVVSMGKSLQMRVVAEGVETNAQARMLKELDCDELQGYLISRPMPASSVEDFLSAQANLFIKQAETEVTAPTKAAA